MGSSDALLGTLGVGCGHFGVYRHVFAKRSALDMPGPSAQEVLVKSILATLNDAVVTRQFHRPPCQNIEAVPRSVSAGKTARRFQDLVEKHAVFDAVVAEK